MAKKKKDSKLSSLRIIGGTHRGRKILVAEEPGLRPTGERMRETLFNWLAPYIEGASVLDAFAGTGILGFESISRGAKNALLLENSSAVARQLNQTSESLGLEADIRQQNALEFFRSDADLGSHEFDVIFLDPPFDTSLLQQSMSLLDQSHLLKPNALIYLEWAKSQPQPVPPQNWAGFKEKSMGDVSCAIYQLRLA